MMTTEITQAQRDAAARKIIGEAGFWNEGEDLTTTSFDSTLYKAGAAEYLILTDEEADEKATEYIRESLWAFNASFLVGYVPEGVTQDVLEMISAKSEGGNEAMVSLVGDRFEDLVEDAISADGRGHFISFYDSEEIEENIDGVYWYGYRIN